ncbi:MAG: LysR family transcriptional regulator [Armatimonadota bacterium]
MDATLNQLKVFREVARHGHFGRAAEALFVSAPAVSKSVKDLERQVGLPLFEQIARRTTLTDAGRMLLGYVERVLTELADADAALAALRGGEAGRLVVGASSTPGTYLLPERLGRFHQEHPGVEVSLEISDTREILARVVGGRLDLAVVGETAFPEAVIAERLWEETLVLIAQPGHRRVKSAAPFRPPELAGEPLVLRERGSSTREVLERALRECGLEPRVAMELGSTEAVKRSVAAGLGVALVSEHAVDLEVQAGVLVTRPLTGLQLRRGFYLVRRSSLHLTALHRQFLAELR